MLTNDALNYLVGMLRNEGIRTDAVDTTWFKRELEHVEANAYEQRYPALRAREFIPTAQGIPEWARVHVWREVDFVGSAEFISNAADDLPSSDVFGSENTKVIKPLGASYQWDYFEMMAAAATNRSLDRDRGNGARRSIETKIDDTLATGNSGQNLQGLLNLANTSSYTLMTKARGGTTWGTMAVPNATADEVVADICGFATYMHTVTKGVWGKFMMLLPLEQYAYASQIRLGDNTTTALAFAKSVCPYLEDVQPWIKCDNAGAGGTSDRIVCYARDSSILAGIVPIEFRPLPLERKSLKYIVPCIATCGGVVSKAPVTVGYADGS